MLKVALHTVVEPIPTLPLKDDNPTTVACAAKAAVPAFKEGEGVGIRQVMLTSNKSKSKTVDVVNSTMALLYYESILQDSVRATVTYSDTGNTIDEKTAMEGLPIVGQEHVKLKFTDNNSNEIDLEMYVNKVTPLLEDTRKLKNGEIYTSCVILIKTFL